MSSNYGIFGAINKEAPQLTMARSVLGVGRDADYKQIKDRHRELLMVWHQDKHFGKPTEKEAKTKTQMYNQAYNVLTSSSEREKAEDNFYKAMMQPFLVGDRVFCLGTLYGMRIYIPSGSPAITDTRRMLTGEVKSYVERDYSVYGVRNSILESLVADQMEMYYGGTLSDSPSLEDAFLNRKQGGLDDLSWIKGNAQAFDCFMNHDFEKAVKIMFWVNKLVDNNSVFMYRYGVCLEAFAANNRKLGKQWKPWLKKAIGLYGRSLTKLENHMVWEGQEDYLHGERIVKVPSPESKLTTLMQLADAYAELGHHLKSHYLWAEVKKIDPSCYEASEKGRNLLLLLPVKLGRKVHLLPKPG